MKKVILIIWTLMSITSVADAQKNNTKSGVKKETTTKHASVKKQTTSPRLPVANGTTTLASNSANSALAVPTDSLRIADPTIQVLNANAKGANIKLGPSGLIGVPRGTYGFANGKILLYSNGATS